MEFSEFSLIGGEEERSEGKGCLSARIEPREWRVEQPRDPSGAQLARGNFAVDAAQEADSVATTPPVFQRLLLGPVREIARKKNSDR